MATFTEFHGISMAENSFIENLVIETLTTDPVPTEAGRIWFNSTDKQYKVSSLDSSGGVIVRSFGTKEDFDAYVANIASQTRGEGSALVGYAGKTGANNKFSLSAGTAEASFDNLVDGIDANAQALADLGTGTLTAIQNEVDAIETGAGLNTDGTYITPSGTYISSSSSLANATELLDAQVKTNADGLAAELAARAAADDLKVDKAGDSMTGDLSMTNNRITNVGAPVDSQDAANKVYVDNALQGISWKEPVKATTTENITLSGTPTIDGVVLAAGDRVLVKDQTNKVENGIYVVSSDTWTRATDFDDTPDTEVEKGDAVFVENGTAYGSCGFTLLGNNTDGTAGIQVGSDELDFIQFSGAGQVIAGTGISKNGNEIFVNMGAGIVELPSDEVGIDVLPTGSIFTTLDGTTASVDAGAQLAIKLDGTTLTSTADGLKVSDTVLSGISNDITTVQNELDVTQTGAGLETDGTYAANTNANYISGAASLKQADNMLDAQVKTNTDGLASEITARSDADTAIQTELDNTQTGAGLGTDGAYTANTNANYISNASSLKDADDKLDAQVKINADGLAQEVIDRTAAVNDLKSSINGNTVTFESTSPATSHVVKHNLASPFVTVAMWVKQDDGSFKNDIAQITLTDNNSLTVDLTVARDIRVVVTAPTDV